MGRLREKKKKDRAVSLGVFYLKYIVRLIIGVLLIVGIMIIFFGMLLYSNIVYPANYAEKQAKAAYESIRERRKVEEEMIPELVQYVVFSENGDVISGNMKKKNVEKARERWQAAVLYDSFNTVHAVSAQIGMNYYDIIKLEQDYCILQYKIMVQYQSAFLRNHFPPPEIMMIIVTVVLTLFYTAFSAFCFGRALKEKLNLLIGATEKIQDNNLDFTILSSKIKEIDTVLDSMDKMRTALKESLETQWKSEQQKREQIAALAHDLKTPLTLIRGNAELLSDMEPDGEQKECIACIEDSSLQMQTYVQMMIEAVTSESILRIQKKSMDFSSFLRKMQEKCRGLCTVGQVTLEWSYDYHAQTLYADEMFLTRALLNIVSNAVEHTPVGGSVSFEAREADGGMVFVISDTGGGFGSEALRHAKEQFYMEDASRGSKQHFGMGLYIADSVAKQHGGSLTLGNSREKGGAEVVLRVAD